MTPKSVHPKAKILNWAAGSVKYLIDILSHQKHKEANNLEMYLV